MVCRFCLSCHHLGVDRAYCLGYCREYEIYKKSTLHNCTKYAGIGSTLSPEERMKRLLGVAQWYLKKAEMMTERAHLLEKYVDYLADPEAGDMDHLREDVGI